MALRVLFMICLLFAVPTVRNEKQHLVRNSRCTQAKLGLPSESVTSGRCTVNVACGRAVVSSSRPPSASTSARASAKPIPVPLALALRGERCPRVRNPWSLIAHIDCETAGRGARVHGNVAETMSIRVVDENIERVQHRGR